MERRYGRMTQSKLFDEDFTEDKFNGKLVPNFEVSEAARNATYQMIKPDLPESRRRVYEIILQYPDGICNKQIALELGVPINCVTGRVKELRDLGLVIANGIKPIPDYKGRMHPNTLWRAL